MGLNVTPQGSSESAGPAGQGATRLWDPARLLSVQAAWGLHLDWGPHACVQLGQGPPSGVRGAVVTAGYIHSVSGSKVVRGHCAALASSYLPRAPNRTLAVCEGFPYLSCVNKRRKEKKGETQQDRTRLTAGRGAGARMGGRQRLALSDRDVHIDLSKSISCSVVCRPRPPITLAECVPMFE